MDAWGKLLMLVGAALVLAGALLWLLGRSGGGMLPGDIVVEKRQMTFYFPVVTCLVISALLSLILWLLRR